jgi:hypothetical protein
MCFGGCGTEWPPYQLGARNTARKTTVPAYGHHRGRNLARVIIDGKHIYLGRPALAIGSIDHGPGHELAWVVIAKGGGAITVEPISSLRGSGFT